MNRRIGFIGCGNMGAALARAVCKSAGAEWVILANRTPEKAQRLAAELHCHTGENDTVARECGYIFLGVKPQMMAEMLQGIAPVLRARQDEFVLVSMAGGLTTETIRSMAGTDCAVIRIMPNTPVAVGAGVVQMCARGASAEQMEYLRGLLSPAGLIDELPEELIDAASAVSGCGPAFFELMIEAMADGGVACGLPRDKALAYAVHTALGVGKLAAESGEHPGVMKDRVCSPGGSTIQGVRALEKGGARSAMLEAVIAAYEKSREMGKAAK